MKKSATAALIVSGVVGGGLAGASAPDILSDPADPGELFGGEADLTDEFLLDGVTVDESDFTGTELAQTIYGGDPDRLRSGSGIRSRDRLQGGRTFGTVTGRDRGDMLQAPGGLRRDRLRQGGGLIDGSSACCTIEAN